MGGLERLSGELAQGRSAVATLGVTKLDAGIRESAARRLKNIRNDLKNAGDHYPREDVRKAQANWKIET
ncbi:hypothetical protein [Bradyrhizobium liaoningense]